MRLPWLLAKDIVLSRDTLKKGLGCLAAADLTRTWTQDFCEPMPLTPKDYLTFGTISFGFYALSLQSFALFMPGVWVIDKIDKSINELNDRKKAYIDGKK